MNLIGVCIFLAALLSPEQQQEISDINTQISSSLKEMKRHEALANKYADTAFRLQHNHKQQDAKRFYDMEDREREISKYLQMEVDALEKRKAEILGT